MATENQKNQMLATLSKLSNANTEKPLSPVVQKVSKIEEPKKTGRKNHRMEGVEYVRLSPAIPKALKDELDIAIRTTHKAYPTIDTFITEAVRVFLAMKK
jgi:hypothetical protein